MDEFKIKPPISSAGSASVAAAAPLTKDAAKMEDAARQFEGLLVQEMMKSMWQTVPKGELVSGSSEEEMFRDMLNEAVAKQVSDGRGIGIKDVILKDMKQLDKAKKVSVQTE